MPLALPKGTAVSSRQCGQQQVLLAAPSFDLCVHAMLVITVQLSNMLSLTLC